MNRKPFITKRYFTILIVCIVTGFIIGFSYNLSKDNREKGTITSAEYQKENMYRKQLIEQKERNKELTDELQALEKELHKLEKTHSIGQAESEELLEKVNELRLQLGQIPMKGEGVRIKLEDGNYDPSTSNPNDYIIHESHLFKLVNELKIAGAKGISINGQRLLSTSYIVCNGPVITIDGNQYPAPFVIEAVGNQKTLISAIELKGGVVDQLLTDEINVTIEPKDQLELKAVKIES